MFERRSSVIKYGNKLSFDYVPEKIIHRESQMKDLEILFGPMVHDNRMCTAFLHGGVGTGKTVTAKRFSEDLNIYFSLNNRLLDRIFINCRLRNTEFGVILQILRYYDPGFPDRGFSADQMMRTIRTHIEKSARPLLLILDEADMLLKNTSVNIIYQLSRMADELKKPSSISFILISQEYLEEKVDRASMSSFKRTNTIRFNFYSKDEIKSIIQARADEALNPGTVSSDVLDLLADVSSQFGDARFAIEMIERSAQIAESDGLDKITSDCVRSANAMIYSDVSESKLIDLDMNRKLALLSVARAIKKEAYVSISVVEKTYAVVCEEYSHVARKHTQFYTYIQDMEKQNLLSTIVRSEVDGGRVTYISIPNIPPKELAKKLEDILESPISSDDLEM